MRAAAHSQIPYEQVNPRTGESRSQCFGNTELTNDRDGNTRCKQKRRAPSSKDNNYGTWGIVIAILVLLIILGLVFARGTARGPFRGRRRWFGGPPRVVIRA